MSMRKKMRWAYENHDDPAALTIARAARKTVEFMYRLVTFVRELSSRQLTLIDVVVFFGT